jgi:capsular exopolysaccharide synthesis family protein
VLFVLLIENWYLGFRSKEELEGQTGIRVLGIVPVLRGIRPVKKLLRRRPQAKSDPSFHEGIRRVSTAITMLRPRDPTRVLLVTSSVPDEGKSLLSVAIGLQVARSGKKCVLVDCDFRRSRMHSVLGLKDRKGLTELLCGSATLSDVVRRDKESGLHVITAGIIGTRNMRASEARDARDILPTLLGSARMKALIDGLASQYDLVIMDCPPVMVVSEAPILSRLADSTIFVVRWENTRRNVALDALGQLVDAGADVAGIVLSRVNTKKYSKYSFADSELYSTAYQKYY